MQTTARSAANGHDGNGWVRPGGITAAEAFRPAMPLQFQGTRRLPVRRVMLTLFVLAVIAVVVYLLTGGGTPAPARSHHPPARTTRHTAASAPKNPPASSAPSPQPSVLPVASAVAFGPAGPSQGDNPSEAGLAVDGNTSTAWHTDWYAEANLNGTQPGTGLLLDMGGSVTVSSVSVLLGPPPGGTVQLLAGNTPSLADMPMAAQAANPGGTLTLQPAAPVTARYLLIWFTQLPPNNAGAYEAFVYNVSVSGTS
jgi:hypothetical protein